MNKAIESKKAPGAIGPYSQAMKAGNFIYVSGQLPINVETGTFSTDDVEGQTRQSLENVKAILNEAGYDMKDVVKSSVYLSNMKDFVGMNGIYEEFFNAPFPARVAFEVARLPKDALVEIEVIAYK